MLKSMKRTIKKKKRMLELFYDLCMILIEYILRLYMNHVNLATTKMCEKMMKG